MKIGDIVKIKPYFKNLVWYHDNEMTIIDMTYGQMNNDLFVC